MYIRNITEVHDMLTVGTKAPDFILNDQNGAEIRLSDFLGKKVVLYF